MSRRLGLVCLHFSLLLSAVPPTAAAAGDAVVVIYRVRPGDTLIGLGQRLLIERSLWRQVGALNRVTRERFLQPGSQLRIPIAWIRWVPQPIKVRAVSGTVTADAVAVAPGQSLPEGARIQTAADGSMALDLPDGSRLQLPGNTELRLGRARTAAGTDATDVQLDLVRGHTEVEAQKHRDVGRFEIRTPTAITAVRGTRFRSHFNANDASATEETLEGVVAVDAQQTAREVSASFGTRTEQNRPPLPPVKLLAAPDLTLLPAVNARGSLGVSFPPVPQARGYRIQLSHSDEFSALERDVTTTQPNTTFNSLADGIYWVRARAIDGLGLEGLDASRRIEQQQIPQPPTAVQPGPASHIAGSSVRFAWSGGGGRYRLQLAHAADFSELLEEHTEPTGDEWLRQDLPPGHYVWRLAAVSPAGVSGPWSDPMSFDVWPVAPLPQVSLRRGRRVHIEWNARPGYAVLVQIAKDPAFTKLVMEQKVSGVTLDPPRLRMGSYFVRLSWLDPSGHQGDFGAARRALVPAPAWTLLIIPLIVGAALL